MPKISDPVKAMDAGMWVLLWSHRQNAFHIEPLQVMLSNNRAAYADNKGGDYRVLHIGYLEDVEATAGACRATLAGRDFRFDESFKKAI